MAGPETVQARNLDGYGSKRWLQRSLPAAGPPRRRHLTAEFSAPSAGPPPWYLDRVTQATVYASGTAEPYATTRFDLT